jgi:hypothetical protein
MPQGPHFLTARSHRFQSLVAALILSVPSGLARADLVMNFEFDVEGQLPSANPNILFFTDSRASEESLYSVADGMLRQRTFGKIGASSHFYGDIPPGELDPALDFTMEVRLRIHRIEGIAAVYFRAIDSVSAYQVWLSPMGATALTSADPIRVSLNVFDFHTYRLESPGNSDTIRFYVDGVLQGEGIADTSEITVRHFNGFDWGDGFTALGNGADADWDYLRVTNVPEPQSLALLCLAAASLVFRWAFRLHWLHWLRMGKPSIDTTVLKPK